MRSQFLAAGAALFLAVFTVLFLSGCGDGFSPSKSSPGGVGNYGATPGGAQDMKLARELVANSAVPPAEALMVEGMFSEHDLPLEGPGCAALLCARGALGWEDDAGWVQIGLSSNVDPENFTRPRLGVVLLIDVSGSMGWNYGSYGLPAAVTHDLALAFIDEFDRGDAVGIATFDGSAQLVQEFTSGSRHDLLGSRITSLRPGGSTNMGAGLRLARSMFGDLDQDVDDRRVLLLTDAQPNTGTTDPGAFMEMAATMAEEGIGLTVIGVGMGLNPEVMQSLLNLRGGNGFGVASAEEVPQFMANNWPWLVCPIARDLTVGIAPPAGFEVERGYGFPGEEYGLYAATVFLSRNRGALLLRLEGGRLHALGAALTLRYQDIQGRWQTERLELASPGGAVPDDRGRWFGQTSTAKTVALALLVEGLHDAATLYRNDRAESLSMMDRAVGRFEMDVAAILAGSSEDGGPLLRELRFAQDMQSLMKEGAPQGDLYGGF